MLRHALRPATLPAPMAAARQLWSSHLQPQGQHWRRQQRCQHQHCVPLAAAGAGASGSSKSGAPRSSMLSRSISSSSRSSSSVAASSLAPNAAGAGSASSEAAAEAGPPPKPAKQSFGFCRMCGGRVELTLPEGDSRWRHQCTSCGFIDYQNPRLVVGCIVQHEGKILLCRRGIEPQRGLWTVPAGFLENGESTAAGAVRETMEEAGAAVTIDAPYVHFDIPGISQVYVLFRGRLAPPFTFSARQPETLEARLFAPEEVPFDELAFSSVSIALKSYLADLSSGSFRVHHGVITKRPGAGPNEPGSFSLEDHIELPTSLGLPDS